MKVTGGCYCGEVRYEAEGEVVAKAMCTCRQCQHIAGGGPSMIMGMPEAGFSYTQGEARAFARSDLAEPAVREFCPNCGTHLLTRTPRSPGAVLLKVGSLDDLSVFGMPQVAVHTGEKQPYHVIPEGVRCFATVPGQ
jgi:hypothetical protein